MALCDKCLALDLESAVRRLQHTKGTGRADDDESGWLYGWHARPILVYESSAATGCALCRFVTQGWQEYRELSISNSIREGELEGSYPFEDLHASVVGLTAYRNAEIDTVVLRLERANDGRQKWSYALRVACRPLQTDDWDWQIHPELLAELTIAIDSGRPESVVAPLATLKMDMIVHRQPMSAPSLAVVRGWLDTCLRDHEACRQRGGSVYMPSRFLDAANPNRMDQVFLMVRGEDVPVESRYIALSHCWGKAKTITTTTSTVGAHRNGIDIDILPQTFQDAIAVVRSLGLRYVWIDSLCIVQDDARDWEAEAARMADVYRNAHLVLGAARADSDVAGFLGCRDAPANSTELGAFQITLLPPLLQRWTHGTDIIGSEPLSSRAWCLQERCLARRMLHYGSLQTAWECAELRASESGDAIFEEGDQLSRILQTANAGISVFGDVVRSAWNADINSRRRDSVLKYSDWYRLVSQYSARDITKDTDRLPALLGIASALKAVTGDDYVYGTWYGGLLEGLAWCSSTKKGLTRHRKSDAPSWSWASVKGVVEFPIYSWYEYCESQEQRALIPVAKHTVRLASPGTIELRAPIMRVTKWQPIQTPREAPDDPASDIRESLVADTVFQLDTRQHEGPADHAWWLQGAFDDMCDRDFSNDALYIVFLTRLPYVEGSRVYEHILGLVVKNNGKAMSYERLGFVDSWIREAGNVPSSTVGTANRLFTDVDEPMCPPRGVSRLLDISTTEINLV
ncbi:heterokaryon incompatibility protein-domain-containing protein [Xylaria intraflava]|nr:heterokaryon incompatibility protein-domain-containing protein [Xylaria intraflava]